MRDRYTRLFAHCIWGTWDRLPLITPEMEVAVYADIRVECAKIKVVALEVNGTEDHVHAIVEFPSTVTVAAMIKQMKGASSHLATHQVPDGGAFRWQGSYSAFTVSEHEVPKVRQYVRDQKQHHRAGTLITRYELEPADSPRAPAV